MRKLGGTAVAVTAVTMLLIGCASVLAPAESPTSSASPTIPATTSAPTATTLDTAQPTTLVTAQPTAPTVTAKPAKTPRPSKSPTPTKTPTAAPTQDTSPAIVSFDVTPTDVDCSVSPLPTTVHAEWSVKNATGVTISIDGGGVYKAYDGTTGSDDVAWSCGSAEHEYVLATTTGTGTAAQQALKVTRAKPFIDEFFGPTIVGTGPCNQIYHVSLHYSVFNALGATIETNGQVLGNYMGKSNDVAVDFDCRSTPAQLFKLTTIDNYGPPATLETYIVYDGN